MTHFDPAQAATIAVLEDGIKARLATVISADKASIDVFPADPSKYQMVNSVADILVSVGTVTHDDGATGDYATTRVFRLSIVVIARDIGNAMHRNGTVLVEAVLLALGGFVVAPFEPLLPLAERFLANAEGTWIYQVTFQTSAPFVPQVNAEEIIAPLLEHITLHGPADETVEIESA